MDIKKYLEILIKPTSEAGGGSVVALNGALASALIMKAYNMIEKKQKYSLNKKFYEELDELKSYFNRMIKEDGESFTKVLDAYKLPKTNQEQIDHRNAQIQEGYKIAAKSPLNMIINFEKLYYHIIDIRKYSDPMIDTELDIAINQIISGIKSAEVNLKINIKYIKDDEFNSKLLDELNRIKENIL